MRVIELEDVPKPQPLRQAWRNHQFRLLLSAVLISTMGDWIYGVAVPIFVYQQTESAGWVALAVAGRQAAYMLFGSVGGVFADRFDRRRWLVFVNLAQMLLMGVIALLMTTGGHVGVIILVSSFSAVFAATNIPTVFAAVPMVVSEDDLAASNAALSLSQQIAIFVGPAIGAASTYAVSPAFAVVLNALTFAAAGALVLPLRSAGRGAGESREHGSASLLGQLRDGVAAIREAPEARVIVLLQGGSTVIYGFGLTLHVLVSDQHLGLGSSGVGLLEAALGIGSVIAGIFVGRFASRSGATGVLAWSFVFIALPSLVLAFTRSPVVAAAVLLVEGFAYVTFDVLSTTLLQRSVPQHVLGRVYGILVSVTTGTTLAAALLAGQLEHLFGLTAAVALGAVFSLPFLAIAAPGLRDFALVTEVRRQELEDRVEVLRYLPFLASAPRSALESIAAAVTEQTVPPGEAVIRQGDEADDFFVVRIGHVDVEVTDEHGETTVVAQLRRDGWFGEVGILEHKPRNATVRARTMCRLWRIPGDRFAQALEEALAFPSALRGGVAAHLPGRTDADEDDAATPA